MGIFKDFNPRATLRAALFWKALSVGVLNVFTM